MTTSAPRRRPGCSTWRSGCPRYRAEPAGCPSRLIARRSARLDWKVMTTPDAEPQQLSFADLGIDERVLRALTDVGYENPSPIQAATIPPLMEGRHVVGLAQTGA